MALNLVFGLVLSTGVGARDYRGGGSFAFVFLIIEFRLGALGYQLSSPYNLNLSMCTLLYTVYNAIRTTSICFGVISAMVRSFHLGLIYPY